MFGNFILVTGGVQLVGKYDKPGKENAYDLT